MLLIEINLLIPTPIFSFVREYRRFFPPFGYNNLLDKRLLKYTIMLNNGHRPEASSPLRYKAD